jgi:hypothetical protein
MMKTLEYLTGITASECGRLRGLNVRHTNALLHATTLEADRRTLSRKTGISAERLLELGNQCALLEISGMERHQKTLWRLGVTSLKELKKQDPAELHRRLLEAVGYAGAPTLSEVQYWVSQARSIDVIEEDEPSAAQSSPSLLGGTREATRTVI